jgi:hypothetical protein
MVEQVPYFGLIRGSMGVLLGQTSQTYLRYAQTQLLICIERGTFPGTGCVLLTDGKSLHRGITSGDRSLLYNTIRRGLEPLHRESDQYIFRKVKFNTPKPWKDLDYA